MLPRLHTNERYEIYAKSYLQLTTMSHNRFFCVSNEPVQISQLHEAFTQLWLSINFDVIVKVVPESGVLVLEAMTQLRRS